MPSASSDQLGGRSLDRGGLIRRVRIQMATRSCSPSREGTPQPMQRNAAWFEQAGTSSNNYTSHAGALPSLFKGTAGTMCVNLSVLSPMESTIRVMPSLCTERYTCSTSMQRRLPRSRTVATVSAAAPRFGREHSIRFFFPYYQAPAFRWGKLLDIYTHTRSETHV